MNDYTKHLCANTPESLKYEANQLAAVLGMSSGDFDTFINFIYKTPNDIKCSIASNLVTPGVLSEVGKPLARPEWDVDNKIDMEAAILAQSKLKFDDYSDVDNSITVSTTKQLPEFMEACQLTVIPWNPE